MKELSHFMVPATLLILESLASAAVPRGDDPPRIVSWNDLGMHCIDPDFSVFSILPPFNTLNSQVILNGMLADSAAGVTVTYEGVHDATGSINTTSIGKTNFWEHVLALFGVALRVDVGLAGNAAVAATHAIVSRDGEQW